MMVLMIAIGGALGAVARYLLVTGAARLLGGGFPYGVMAANVLGSFAMGIAVAVLIDRASGDPHWAAPLLMTGFLGGFTTFSAYSLDAYLLAEGGRWVAFVGYTAGSVVLSFIALAAGITLARGLGG